jgi:hypothetical protein
LRSRIAWILVTALQTLSASIAPVGRAWEEALRRQPALVSSS